jgi:hypothetical protein
MIDIPDYFYSWQKLFDMKIRLLDELQLKENLTEAETTDLYRNCEAYVKQVNKHLFDDGKTIIYGLRICDH